MSSSTSLYLTILFFICMNKLIYRLVLRGHNPIPKFYPVCCQNLRSKLQLSCINLRLRKQYLRIDIKIIGNSLLELTGVYITNHNTTCELYSQQQSKIVKIKGKEKSFLHYSSSGLEIKSFANQKHRNQYLFAQIYLHGMFRFYPPSSINPLPYL